MLPIRVPQRHRFTTISAVCPGTNLASSSSPPQNSAAGCRSGPSGTGGEVRRESHAAEARIGLPQALEMFNRLGAAQTSDVRVEHEAVASPAINANPADFHAGASSPPMGPCHSADVSQMRSPV
jgi:hypothetical protein